MHTTKKKIDFRDLHALDPESSEKAGPEKPPMMHLKADLRREVESSRREAAGTGEGDCRIRNEEDRRRRKACKARKERRKSDREKWRRRRGRGRSRREERR
jgi:hypothetical protein